MELLLENLFSQKFIETNLRAIYLKRKDMKIR